MGPHYQNLTSPSTQTMGLPLPHFSVETRSYDAVLRGCNIARLAQIHVVFLRQNLVFQVCGELHMGPHTFLLYSSLVFFLDCEVYVLYAMSSAHLCLHLNLDVLWRI